MNLEEIIKKFKKHPVEEFKNRTNLFEPLVTVVVCTYNHRNYIKKCIDGILSQKTNFEFEIYIGEDCSTDNTRAICIEYAKNYPDKIRLFLHNDKNKIFINGRPNGRFNFLYSFYKARGKYISLCEGDDFWTDENKMQEQVNFLETNTDFSLSFTNIRHVNSMGVIIKDRLVNYKIDVFTHETFVAKISPPTLSTVFRKDALPENYPDEFLSIINADMFIKAAASRHGKIKYINKITGSKCQHKGGIYVGNSFFQREEAKLFTLYVMLKYFESKKVRNNIKQAMNITYSRLLFHYLKQKKIKQFFSTLLSTIKFYLVNIQTPPVHFFYTHLKNKKINVETEP
jgi:glycosyltransferase involved in cell wall biosynthesis